MAETALGVDRLAAAVTRADAPRHAALVRVTHWLTTVCFLALLVSGLEIVVSHPRFYWGESGNVLTPTLFSLPIPASRATVPTGYGFVLPDQNGWSRALHFQSAWVLVLTGALYVIWGAVSGHFRRHLLPEPSDRSVQAFSRALARHLRFARPAAADAWSYNLVQRLTYLAGDLRAVPARHLDRPGDVAGVRLGVAVHGHAARRPAVRAHAAFPADGVAGGVPAGPRRDGLVRRIRHARHGDDHGRARAHERA